MAAAWTFCRFLQREGLLIDNPFSLLKGPRKAKTAEIDPAFAENSADVFRSNRMIRASPRFVERRMKRYLAEAGLPTDLTPRVGCPFVLYIKFM